MIKNADHNSQEIQDAEKRLICLVIPSLQAGGMERVMSQLVGYLSSRNGLEIHLVLYGITRQIFYSIPDNITIHKPSFLFNNRLRTISIIRTMFFLRKCIRSIKPYSVLSFGEYWNSFVLIALYGLPYQVFISDRCRPDKKLGALHDRLRKIMYPGATGIIAQTQTAKEIFLKQRFNTNIISIGNPIKSVETTVNNREKIILNVGRLISTKNHDILIRIFLKISKPGWRLLIVGYDHLNQKVSEKLQKMISDGGAEDKITLAGKQSDIDEYYLKSEIFAFTSSSEGFPNVIGEAMTAGLPTVAFDCIAGPSEMITDGRNGFLIPLFDEEVFRQKLEFLMDHDDVRTMLGTNAREDIKKYSMPAVGEQYLKVLTGQKSMIN